MLLPAGRRLTVIDDTDALLARGCRRASQSGIESFLPPASECSPNTSGSSLGCLRTGGGAGALVTPGSVFARENEMAVTKLK